jgi:hypothetical protein
MVVEMFMMVEMSMVVDMSIAAVRVERLPTVCQQSLAKIWFEVLIQI